MLLRTSSAPVLSSLGNPSFSQAEACKDSVEPPHYVHSPNLSSFHSLASPPALPCRASSDRHVICGGDDTHTGLTSELEMDRISRPPRLSRAQSEGDLACFTAAMGTIPCDNPSSLRYDNTSSSIEWNRRVSRVSTHSTISPFDTTESILEEVDEPEQPRMQVSSTHCSLPLLDPSRAQAIVLNDGELYSSFKLSPSGSTLACNGKGCRPLTDSECKKLGFLDMASGVGDSTYGWTGYNDGLHRDSSHSREAYYQNLLQTDPENPLLLRNYAEYLSKNGDLAEAEEYLGRAILADPSDGEVLSQYAKLQWDVNRDQKRAETYYGQAVQVAPDDCFVMASYASFLWDVEENEETSPAAPAAPAYGATPLASSPLVASA